MLDLVLSATPKGWKIDIILSDHLFDFAPIFKCHIQRMKESIGFSDAERYAKSFEKKKTKKNQISRSL